MTAPGQGLLDAVAAVTRRQLGGPYRAVGGGSINSAWRVSGDCGDVLLKVNDARYLPMFHAEARGLAELAEVGAVRVPAVLGVGSSGEHAWLALEWLALRPADPACQRRLGVGLAALHRHTTPRHGWHQDNTIGSTPQVNTWTADWSAFWRDCRLAPQLALARTNGAPRALLERGARVLDALPALLAGHRPVASLLHGDLWSGNQASDAAGEPVIFDPAVYYGDRETDLAMTRLFGGFDRGFYAAYAQAWPLPHGWQRRDPLYRLYHVLNHFNLFGAGYAAQAEELMEAVLRVV